MEVWTGAPELRVLKRSLSTSLLSNDSRWKDQDLFQLDTVNINVQNVKVGEH